MPSKTILHLIDSLGRGGAENLLVNTVNALPAYEHIVVYLHAPHDLADEFKDAKVICLRESSGKNILPLIISIKKIIKTNGVSIVHSHSYLTHIISRLSSPKSILLVNSYHFADYLTRTNGYIKNRMIFLDRLTYSKRVKIVAVSNFVAGILKDTCGYEAMVLPNYIGDAFFAHKKKVAGWNGQGVLKLISIGNLKKEKNYELIIAAFGKLKDQPIELDVYGAGEQLQTFHNILEQQQINNLRFKGGIDDVDNKLYEYHAYVMSSYSEACPLSPIEAMSAGLPLILSSIPALTEIAGNAALYFQSNNVESFVTLITNIVQQQIKMKADDELYTSILERYSKPQYLNLLNGLYEPLARYEQEKNKFTGRTNEISYINPFNGCQLKINEGGLCADGKIIFPIIRGAIRIAEDINYTSNFGYQWNKFPGTQIDTNIDKLELSKQRFFYSTGWDKEDLTSMNILEAGSGAGRFTQVVLAHTKAKLYSFDYSNAVEANFENNKFYGQRLALFQASIYELPFAREQFDKVFCFGVLQHTPNVKKSVQCLASMVKKGGELVVDFYPITGWWTKVHIKYMLRPFTRQMNHEKLLRLIEKNADWMIGLSQTLHKLGVGRITNRFIPICDIHGTLPPGLNKHQLREWVVLDTFDMFSPAYDQPQKLSVVENWFREFGFREVHAEFINYNNNRSAIVKGIK
jgi:glycosyltransferase involved in cell wall biosynthesis/2-polyprenyl-3-methyl-5-hydroxy-6-metoxy-1,4-benzoquinol methylase